MTNSHVYNNQNATTLDRNVLIEAFISLILNLQNVTLYSCTHMSMTNSLFQSCEHLLHWEVHSIFNLLGGRELWTLCYQIIFKCLSTNQNLPSSTALSTLDWRKAKCWFRKNKMYKQSQAVHTMDMITMTMQLISSKKDKSPLSFLVYVSMAWFFYIVVGFQQPNLLFIF